MNITVDPQIHDNELFNKTVQQSNGTLQDFANRSPNGVSAEWEVTRDEKNEPALTLRLKDAEVAVEKTFSAEELADPERVWFRLSSLFTKLLLGRSGKILERLLADKDEQEE